MLHTLRLLFAALVSALLLTGGGCAPLRTLHSVPKNLVDQAQIPRMPHVRTWGDHVDNAFLQSMADSLRQFHAYHMAHPENPAPTTVDILALSGGADDGAFGAGVLCGWTARGDRPEFRLVTGISTGALIAPFAFLGPKYDPVLRHNYTTIRARDVATFRGILALLDQDGLYNTHPLRRLIHTWISDEVIQQVAAEHAKGRRLYVATVNLETGRPVIWDMGAIASSTDPQAPELFRTVLLASASIPGAFEPQYITVEARGQRYEEMHVDGGSVAQVFLYGVGVDLNTIARRAGMREPRPNVRLFIIRNGRLCPEYEKIVPLCEPIARRAISSLIIAQGISDVTRLYVEARREGMEYNLASITPDFQLQSPRPFDHAYMSAVFEYGYKRSVAGTVWAKAPPFLGESPRGPLNVGPRGAAAKVSHTSDNDCVRPAG